MGIDLAVRGADSRDELAGFFALAAEVFFPHEPADRVIAIFRHDLVAEPGFQLDRIRLCHADGELVGGYALHSRRLRVGASRLSTLGVAGVVAHPAHRRRGIGRALMLDALAYAEEHGHALLLLAGIAGFYGRFGYVDVLDIGTLSTALEDVFNQPASALTVRLATPHDAPALLRLYEAHYGVRVGGAARTLEDQLYHQAVPMAEGTLFAAAGADGWLRGYISYPLGAPSARAREVAADDWPTALALLHHHAARVRSLDPRPAELAWPLPRDSVTAHLVADHLPARAETRSRPDAGWLARAGDLHALLDGLQPAWQQRWQERPADWSGTLALHVGEARTVLALAPRTLAPAAAGARVTADVRLSPEALVQLVFGWRSAGYLAAIGGVSADPALLPVLDALFPVQEAWIAGSDSF